MRIAIIDLGTNTFNLLIADVESNKTFSLIYSEKRAVKLGENTINQQLISPAATIRAVEALRYYTSVCTSHEVEKITAFATSAVRSANNKAEFLSTIRETCGLEIVVIDGNKEAELIYYGVRLAVDMKDTPTLIMDIGGGSNEFILANAHQVFWKQSFPLGMARMIDRFKPEDPILPSTIAEVQSYFTTQLAPLWEATQEINPHHLIGSSGSFDTFRTLLSAQGHIPKNSNVSSPIPFMPYQQLHQQLILSTKKERESWAGMDNARVEMIVMASIFTQVVINRLKITELTQSNYALKEGALTELIS